MIDLLPYLRKYLIDFLHLHLMGFIDRFFHGFTDTLDLFAGLLQVPNLLVFQKILNLRLLVVLIEVHISFKIDLSPLRFVFYPKLIVLLVNEGMLFNGKVYLG